MTRQPYPSELQDRFMLRFPDGMRDKLAEIAKRNGRSMNAEIIARLQASLEADEQMAQFDQDDPLRNILLALQGMQGFEKAIAQAVLMAKEKYEGGKRKR